MASCSEITEGGGTENDQQLDPRSDALGKQEAAVPASQSNQCKAELISLLSSTGNTTPARDIVRDLVSKQSQRMGKDARGFQIDGCWK